MSTKRNLIQTLQIATGVLEYKSDSDTINRDMCSQNFSNSDTINSYRCSQNISNSDIQIGKGVYENNSDSDTANRDRCPRKQLQFRHYK